MMPDMGFSFSFHSNQLPKLPADLCSGHARAEKRPPASSPAVCLGLNLNCRQQEQTGSASTPTPCPGLQQAITPMLSVALLSGWLLCCPQKGCLRGAVLVTGWGTPCTEIRKADFGWHKLDKPPKCWRLNMPSKQLYESLGPCSTIQLSSWAQMKSNSRRSLQRALVRDGAFVCSFWQAENLQLLKAEAHCERYKPTLRPRLTWPISTTISLCYQFAGAQGLAALRTTLHCQGAQQPRTWGHGMYVGA